ncbi:alpha/beta hydrolase [Alteromonas sp. ALT199]|uniref:alpha/beta hydrolase-fold protein n=1 Tax=unclassified Alteromonas TaxID=2614992 RepID=UPI001BE6A7CE|nr:alpha/beta hydrolase-fold protein [Alteromonas sp. ALT199]MBT3136344.1 alpha/beta hydrolase [Alteromonas sp. ALT199]
MYQLFIIIALVVYGMLPSTSLAKVRGEATTINIYSDILKEKRELIVYLPNSYHISESSQYPVMYLLDGQRNVFHTSGTLDLLVQSKMADEMIVIGITNTKPSLNFTPTHSENYAKVGESGGADNFIRFLEKELRPWVDKKYRTNKFNVLSGHSLSGLFTIYTLHKNPDLFQAYFAFSPSLWWDNQVILDIAASFYEQKGRLNKFLYVNMGSEGGQMLSGFERYKSLVESTSINGFMSKFELDTSENHNTIALVGNIEALKYLYNNLNVPADIIDKGEMAIDDFYKTQSSTYKYNATVDYTSMKTLGYKALANNDINTAIRLFEQNTHRFPYKAEAFDSLADAYEANGQLKKALEALEFAIVKSTKENVENSVFITRRDSLLKRIISASK